MKFKILFFAFLLLFSCRIQTDQCNPHTEEEIREIDEMMNSPIAYDGDKMKLASAYDQLIQFHAEDGWGGYKYTIRLYQVNHQHIIEVKSSARYALDRVLNAAKKKIELNPRDVERIWSKANLLFCKEVDLEPDMAIIDGNEYELLIKDGIHQQAFRWQEMQAFSWQEMQNGVHSGRIPGYKSAVIEMVGDLMRLSQFPSGDKFIAIDTFNTTDDSIALRIDLAYSYNVLYHKVYFDKKILHQDVERQAYIKVPVSDTINLRQRIRIKATLLDNSEIEL